MSGETILIEQLRADVERLTAERDAAFEQGRLVGRADVAKYARAIGEIESVVGIVGAVPMPQTVQAVRDLVSRAEKAERERADAIDAMNDERETVSATDAEAARLRERAEKAERERDELRSAHGQSFLRVKVERDDAIERAEKAERELDALRHHYDEASPEHNLLALLDMYDERLAAAESERDAYKRAKEENGERFMRERDEWKDRHDTLADVSRACIATVERERDEARAERDARPDISAEDAAALVADYERVTDPVTAAEVRALAALRAHAAKVKP